MPSNLEILRGMIYFRSIFVRLPMSRNLTKNCCKNRAHPNTTTNSEKSQSKDTPSSPSTERFGYQRTYANNSNLQHAGVTRLINTIGTHFGYPGIRKEIEELVRSCDTCQRHKITGKKQYGKIPLTPALRDKEPWQVVHIDCNGPWDIQYENEITGEQQNQKLNLLTISDACLGWVEFLVMKNKTAKHTAHLFDIHWLCRYPRPQRVIYDNGSEFMGFEFQELLESYGIEPQPTTIKNPQANSVIERLHLTLGDQLRCTTFKRSKFSRRRKCHRPSIRLRCSSSNPEQQQILSRTTYLWHGHALSSACHHRLGKNEASETRASNSQQRQRKQKKNRPRLQRW